MENQIPVLIEALNDNDFRIRNNAAVELGKLGTQARSAIPALILGLKDNHYNVRRVSAEALGKMGELAQKAIPYLLEALVYHSMEERISKKGSNLIRINSIQALCLIGPDRHCLPALIASLMDDDPEARLYAAKALGLLGESSQEAIPDLVQALTDPNTQVRGEAIASLEKIATNTNLNQECHFAIPALLEALKDNDFRIRRIATKLLKKITNKKYPFA